MLSKVHESMYLPDHNQDRDKFKPDQTSEITQTALFVLTDEFKSENLIATRFTESWENNY